MIRATIIALAALAVGGGPLLAHPGGLNAEGCHYNRKTGDYHCHRKGASAAPRAAGGGKRPAAPASGYRNCAAARAAGAAPVHRGDPGYHPRLDRDRDGIGCE
ncbi:YHYH domain-containing protein [Paracoccus suum]|uniref:YHYH domain-containing protein n=1 Tax=Paracoccus suum TaxID=2259340 RepID=A0A344PHI3_9RHOB|nr:excalibur calcium-binding domain-containing protein [Paracoccus suum]AXC48838.1 YHYH domain-containing protein [Paracoccus suum]